MALHAIPLGSEAEAAVRATGYTGPVSWRRGRPARNGAHGVLTAQQAPRAQPGSRDRGVARRPWACLLRRKFVATVCNLGFVPT